MKKARQVEVPQERPLTFDEYMDLSTHAYNSVNWQVQQRRLPLKALRDKLYAKGYPREGVTYEDPFEGLVEVNLVEEALQRLVDLELVDDEAYAEAFLRSQVGRGKALSQARFLLMAKGVDEAIVELVVERLQAEDDGALEAEAFQKALRRVMGTSTYEALPPLKRKEKLLRTLCAKGFSFEAVVEAYEEDEARREEGGEYLD